MLRQNKKARVILLLILVVSSVFLAFLFIGGLEFSFNGYGDVDPDVTLKIPTRDQEIGYYETVKQARSTGLGFYWTWRYAIPIEFILSDPQDDLDSYEVFFAYREHPQDSTQWWYFAVQSSDVNLASGTRVIVEDGNRPVVRLPIEEGGSGPPETVTIAIKIRVTDIAGHGRTREFIKPIRLLYEEETTTDSGTGDGDDGQTTVLGPPAFLDVPIFELPIMLIAIIVAVTISKRKHKKKVKK